MKFSEVRDIVKEIPFISEENAKILYDTILHQKPSDCLELGFAHGAASCYIAAALDKLGHGHLTAVDLIEAQEWQKPSIDDLLARCGLGEYVTVVREQTGYNWFLHDEIVRGSESDLCEPKYDLCVIDGSKNWTIDGLAFLLVDKLLREGGSEGEQLRRRLLSRMHDISEYMKSLKQRYTLWYNGVHGRVGTLWSERFKSVLVEGEAAALQIVSKVLA